MKIHFYIVWIQRKNLWRSCRRKNCLCAIVRSREVQDVFAQILKELMSRMQRRKEAATEIEKEPWIILLIDDIKECNSLPDDIQMQLHRIMTKTKGYGVLVLCGIRQGDLFNFYNAGSARRGSQIFRIGRRCLIRQCITKAFL